MRLILIWLLLTSAVWAEDERAGEFDYYVLSLSWSPSWCALEGDARAAPQCKSSRNSGWVLHGLWPQYEQGWPSYCRSTNRDPSRTQTTAMSDIMGSSGAAWYQWKKHGRCSGLSADAFFEAARAAYAAVNRPEVFRKLSEPVRLSASTVKAAFLQSNADWEANTVTVTCKGGRIQEIRLCLTKQLQVRSCGVDVANDCRLEWALLDEIR